MSLLILNLVLDVVEVLNLIF